MIDIGNFASFLFDVDGLVTKMCSFLRHLCNYEVKIGVTIVALVRRFRYLSGRILAKWLFLYCSYSNVDFLLCLLREFYYLHVRVARLTSHMQSPKVSNPIIGIIFSQFIEIIPGENARIMTVTKSNLNSVITRFLYLWNNYVALTKLQYFLTFTVPAHLGTRRKNS